MWQTIILRVLFGKHLTAQNSPVSESRQMSHDHKRVEQAAEQQDAGLNPQTILAALYLHLDHAQQNRLQSAAPLGMDLTEFQHAGEKDTAGPLTKE